MEEKYLVKPICGICEHRADGHSTCQKGFGISAYNRIPPRDKFELRSYLKLCTETVRLSKEDFGLICDAIEIAIGHKDFECECHERFEGMKNEMMSIVDDIEKQSGCQTKDD